MNKTTYTSDTANNKLEVVREFDAPLPDVWKAWTDSESLDQWWAPKPWKANTQSMDFREGGTWLYFMEGPDASRQYCRLDYRIINANEYFTGKDAFCDEKGNISTELPTMLWNVGFISTGDKTKVDVEVTFASAADMEKIIEMGFKEGFAAAHENLDALLSKGNN